MLVQDDQDMQAPSGLVCRPCGYDLAGLRTRRCPECGAEFGEAEIAAVAARRTAVARLPRRHLLHVAGIVAMGVLGGGVAMVYGAELATGLITACLLAAAPAATVLMGSMCARLWPRRDRAVFQAVWIDSCGWLWAPLPAAVSVSVLALALGWIGDTILAVLGVIGVPLLLFLALMSFLTWIGAWEDGSKRLQLSAGRRVGVMHAAALVWYLLILLKSAATIVVGVFLAVDYWASPQ